MRFPRLSQLVPAVCSLGLAAAVAIYGAGDEPVAVVNPPATWDFRAESTPSWVSPNAQVVRVSDGLKVIPRSEPASISSGVIALDAGAYERARVRLSASQPSEGWLWLVVQTPTGTRREPRAFHVRGGGGMEDILVPLALDKTDRSTVREAVLVTSVPPQPVTITSIAFEPLGGSIWAAIRELGSPAPGETLAGAPFAMHNLPPPVVWGRSVWTVLIPVVLLAGMIAMLAGDGSSAFRVAIRRAAWGVVGSVWLFGFGLVFYYQVVALRVDLSRFGGLERAQAYAAIDYVPLWADLREVARSVPPRASVEVVIDWDRPDVVTTWTARAAYYLYPVTVQSRSPFRLRYFGRSHPPCGQVEPGSAVLREGERFCLFGVAG